jgi:toxin ParE1/3/4
MKRVRYQPAAESDLFDILLTIATDHPPAAMAFREKLEASVQRLSPHPFSAPAREHVRPGLRGLSVGRYVVYYRVAKDDVLIVRILHMARDVHWTTFDQRA